jgi:uncharacterized Tic20 family protein
VLSFTAKIEQHGRDVISFQISMCIYLFCASMLAIVLIGVPILILLGWYTGFIAIFNLIRGGPHDENGS